MTVNWDGVIAATNGTSAYLKSLPEGTRTKLVEAFKILGNPNLESADKVAKIDELIAGVQDEKAKEFLHNSAKKAAEVAQWCKERLAKEETEVREGARSFVRLLVCPEFVQASDDDKRAKLDALVSGLNETQLAAFKHFKVEADEKTHVDV